MAAAQYQPFAREEAAFGVLPQVDGHGILSAPVVRVLEGFPADGDEFALVVCRARRFGEPAYLRRPDQVLLSLAQAGYVGFHLLVRLYGEPPAEFIIRVQAGEVVFPAPFRAGRQADEALQHLFLQLSGADGILFDFFQTRGKISLIQ